jgi:hypothetical protein
MEFDALRRTAWHKFPSTRRTRRTAQLPSAPRPRIRERISRLRQLPIDLRRDLDERLAYVCAIEGGCLDARELVILGVFLRLRERNHAVLREIRLISDENDARDRVA